MASYILYEQKRETRETKESIITEAAKLIKSKVKDIDKMSKMYHAFDEFSDIKGQKEWITKTLELLLSYLLSWNRFYCHLCYLFFGIQFK